MKKIILLPLLLVIVFTTLGQQIKPSRELIKQDYQLKSKHQKTAAWVLLGGGAVLLGASLIAGLNEVANSDYLLDANTTGSAVLFFTGIIAAGASIPLFIASARNRRKAVSASLDFHMERPRVMQCTFVAHTSFPALSVKINL